MSLAEEINREDLAVSTPSPLKPLAAALLEDPSGTGEFEELCWQYLHLFPPAITLGQIKTSLLTEESEAFSRAEGPGGGTRLEFDSRIFFDGKVAGQLTVSLYRSPSGQPDEYYLELEQGHIWETELRGRGLGRAMVENVKSLGRVLGVRAITLFAMYDGRFVWPSLGFQFGDYLPQPQKAANYRRAFRAYCRKKGVTPPDLAGWDAPQFARFTGPLKATALTGHRLGNFREQVELGRAFMLSRRPFFLTLPL